MDNIFLCVVLMSVHLAWGALLPVDKIITNAVIEKTQAKSTLRRYITNGVQLDKTGRLPHKLPGPDGPRVKPNIKFPAKSTTTSHAQQTGTSSFMVYKTVEQVGNASDILMFDSVTTNVGNNFDVSTGIYTCVKPGMYFFSFTVITQDYPIVVLAHNEDILATVFRSFDGAGLYDTMSNNAVIQLAAGDQVGIIFMGYDKQSVYGDPYYHYTTFSGYSLS